MNFSLSFKLSSPASKVIHNTLLYYELIMAMAMTKRQWRIEILIKPLSDKVPEIDGIKCFSLSIFIFYPYNTLYNFSAVSTL